MPAPLVRCLKGNGGSTVDLLGTDKPTEKVTDICNYCNFYTESQMQFGVFFITNGNNL